MVYSKKPKLTTPRNLVNSTVIRNQQLQGMQVELCGCSFTPDIPCCFITIHLLASLFSSLPFSINDRLRHQKKKTQLNPFASFIHFIHSSCSFCSFSSSPPYSHGCEREMDLPQNSEYRPRGQIRFFFFGLFVVEVFFFCNSNMTKES